MNNKLDAKAKAFIADNFEKLHVREMAKILDIHIEAIRVFMRRAGYQTLYKKLNPKKSKDLSQKDQDFIRSNSESMTRAQLAREVNNTYHAVSLFMKNEKLHAHRHYAKIILDPPEPPKPKFERPPAVYSNPSYNY